VQHPEYEVHAVRFCRPEFDCPGLIWHQGDLRDPQTVDQTINGMDIVIQAAATTSGSRDIVNQPFIHVTDNAVMNSLLLRAAYNYRVKHFIFFSCSTMYQSSIYALKESDFNPADEIHPSYFGVGWTKVYVEKMCEFFANLGLSRHTVIRHSNIYGPHDKFDLERSHVFGATVTKAMTATDRIVIWGTGKERRDLLYIDDLIYFVDQSIKHQENLYEVFNCGSGQSLSVEELVHKIVVASGRDLKVEHDLTMPSIDISLSLDCNKAKNELGWKPKIELDEGIERTLKWYRETRKNTFG